MDNHIAVFEPTLREVEWLAGMFRKITWIGYGQPGVPKSFARVSDKLNIDFILLPYAVGGKSFVRKFRILQYLPKIVCVILTHLKRHSFIHTRGPSVPALITILISYLDHSRTYWHKYAGNWIQRPAPKAYTFQRFLLTHNSHLVSINGSWPSNPNNFVSLENPCLTNSELLEANAIGKNKRMDGPLTLCFVGALIPAKGIRQFVESLSLVKNKSNIKEVLIVGDGPERNELEKIATTLPIPIQFLGNIKRDAINSIYEKADIIILPSAAEGFPKVIAEAAAFGCVPIVTQISSIDQYITHGKQGMLLQDTDPSIIAELLDTILSGVLDLNTMKNEVLKLSSLFTFERYCLRLQQELTNRLS